jgi:hypothetical protein
MSILSRRVRVQFSPDQVIRLQAIAQAKGESVGALIRKAVETVYLRHEPEKRREAVQRMASLSLPLSDWEQMERESMPECAMECRQYA